MTTERFSTQELVEAVRHAAAQHKAHSLIEDWPQEKLDALESAARRLEVMGEWEKGLRAIEQTTEYQGYDVHFKSKTAKIATRLLALLEERG